MTESAFGLRPVTAGFTTAPVSSRREQQLTAAELALRALQVETWLYTDDHKWCPTCIKNRTLRKLKPSKTGHTGP